MQVAPEADHLRLQNGSAVWTNRKVHHLHLPPDLVCALDMLIFAPIGKS